MVIAITPGDPEGIGPEIVFKTLCRPSALRRRKDLPRFLVIGAPEPFRKLGARLIEIHDVTELPRTKPGELLFLPTPEAAPRTKANRRFSLPGYQCGWAIESATRLALAGQVQAIVTGPISKERLQAGGFDFPGHTEMLAALCRRREVTMMLANDQLRITLVTTHLALKDVSSAITSREITRTLEHTAQSLRDWWGIRRPRIAVAALNPHAGESGLFGTEELRVISPALGRFRRKHPKTVLIEGPLPADTLFAKHAAASPRDKYDAVVCMYHDQGLIPVKLLDFPRTVNVTLGLPIIRTSVDHGVAFDIAGKGIADPSSFQSALSLACAMVRLRKENVR